MHVVRPASRRLRPGAALKYEEYHPYGSTAWWAGDSALVSQKRYRYTGMERDEETGLQFHGERCYAPWLGRWASADPLALAAGTNRFAYASGNPASRYDTNGLNDTSVCDPDELDADVPTSEVVDSLPLVEATRAVLSTKPEFGSLEPDPLYWNMVDQDGTGLKEAHSIGPAGEAIGSLKGGPGVSSCYDCHTAVAAFAYEAVRMKLGEEEFNALFAEGLELPFWVGNPDMMSLFFERKVVTIDDLRSDPSLIGTGDIANFRNIDAYGSITSTWDLSGFWHGEWTVKVGADAYMGHGLAVRGVPVERTAEQVGEKLLEEYNSLAAQVETFISSESGGRASIALTIGTGTTSADEAARREAVGGMRVEIWSVRDDAIDRIYQARGRSRP